MDSNPGFLPVTSVTHPGPATWTFELPGGQQSAARGMSMFTFCECNNHREKKGNGWDKTEALSTHSTSRWGVENRRVPFKCQAGGGRSYGSPWLIWKRVISWGQTGLLIQKMQRGRN